jgi:hypothetical protein
LEEFEMGLLDRVRSRFRPPTLDDPDFGRLLYMHIARDPSRSYWECEWTFPPTGTRISIGLPGSKEGPWPVSRAFFLALVPEFNQIVERVRPAVDRVFRDWLDRPLNNDLWQDVNLAGFGVEDPRATPPQWDVAFETTGAKWLGITVPIAGDQVQEAVVDT